MSNKKEILELWNDNQNLSIPTRYGKKQNNDIGFKPLCKPSKSYFINNLSKFKKGKYFTNKILNKK